MRRTVLAIRFSALGDIAMTVPPLYDACLSNPQTRFIMLTRKGPARLFVNPPENLEVIGVDLDNYKGVGGLWRLASEMRERGVTTVLDLHDVIRSRMISAFLAMRGASVFRIDKGRAEKKRLTRSNLKLLTQLKPGVERYADVFRAAGLSSEPLFKGYFPGGADPSLFAAATPPRRPDETWVAIAPFARHKGKIYPPEMMEQVVADLCSRPGYKVFLFAAGPEEEKRAELWSRKYPELVNLAPLRLGFKGEMALMSHCKAMLSMDSANMHLASLAPTRVVSIWGATHPFCGFMGWRQNMEDAVQVQIGCRPCSVFGNKPCRRGDYLCLKAISPARILKTLSLSLLLLLPLPLTAAAATPYNPLPSSIFAPHPGLPGPGGENPSVLLGRQPQSADADLWRLQIADARYEAGAFADALPLFADVNPRRLPLDMRAGYYFRYANALAHRGLLDEARRMTAELERQKGGAPLATFMNAYLAYRDRDFATARQLFARSPANLLPQAYLGQIEFAEGNWSDALNILEPLISSQNKGLTPGEAAALARLRPELIHCVAVASYRLGDFGKSTLLGEEYLSHSSLSQSAEGNTAGGSDNWIPADDLLYVMADLESRRGNYERAAELLNAVRAEKDAIAQGSAYLLGQISARNGNDQSAALAFAKGARLNYDTSVGEKSLYNYVVSSTRGASVPFSSPAELYEHYVSTVSDRDERHDRELSLRFAREYFREGNYAKALKAIDRIAAPDDEMRAERQQILYELGRREVMSGEYGQAALHLAEAARLGRYSKRIASESNLWLGDAYYGQARYSEAAKAYAEAARSLEGKNRALALYDCGYALFNLNDFRQGALCFEQVLREPAGLDERQLADARMRLADCCFYTGQYARALRGYEEGVTAGGNGADYAAFRRAVLLGLVSGESKKIDALNSFVSNNTSSRWLPDAMLELGQTLAAVGRDEEASAAFGDLSRRYPASAQARRGTLALAQSLTRKGDAQGAMEAYRRVISSWPSSEEAELANNDLRRLAAREGELEEYAAFLRSVPGAPSLDADQLEQLAFEAAESAYADNIDDTRRLEEYLRQFPNGRYVAEALIDLAESRRENGRYVEAVSYVDRLLSDRPDSPRTPEALLLKGEVIEEHIPARLPEALQAYRLLEERGGTDFSPEAYSGIMRTTLDPQESLRYARLLLHTGTSSPETTDEARLYEGMSLLAIKGSENEGESVLRSLAARPETLSGAKGAVELGEFLMNRKRIGDAYKLMSDFTDAGSPHSYWLARGFIILSDACRARGESLLADEYLRSLKANYPGKEADIRDAIATRLSR